MSQDGTRRADHALLWLVGALVLIASVAVAVALIAVARVAAVERTDRNVARSSAYRICTRGIADRAYAHTAIRGLPIAGLPAAPPLSAREREQRAEISRTLMQTPLLAILDCRPNLWGRGARPQSIAEQERYMNAWRQRRLSGAQIGVCPGSRIGAPPDRC